MANASKTGGRKSKATAIGAKANGPNSKAGEAEDKTTEPAPQEVARGPRPLKVLATLLTEEEMRAIVHRYDSAIRAHHKMEWPAENVNLIKSLRHRLFCFLEEQEDVRPWSIDAQNEDSAEIIFYLAKDNGISHRLTIEIEG